MRRIANFSLWIGNALDARNLRVLHAAGIEALVDLGLKEPVSLLSRELIYCRFPLLDGPGNSPTLLRLAVETTARLISAEMPTLIYCSAGMSRSPAIAAFAIARATRCAPAEALAKVFQEGSKELSPLLWNELEAARNVHFREQDDC
jgi:protein-tyrosine phosphatase